MESGYDWATSKPHRRQELHLTRATRSRQTMMPLRESKGENRKGLKELETLEKHRVAGEKVTRFKDMREQGNQKEEGIKLTLTQEVTKEEKPTNIAGEHGQETEIAKTTRVAS